jgi:hypothetical protein
VGSGATSGEAGRKGSSYVRFARRGRWALGWHGEAGVNAASASSVHGYDTHPTGTERTVGVLARGARWHRVGGPGRGTRARAWRCVGGVRPLAGA